MNYRLIFRDNEECISVGNLITLSDEQRDLFVEELKEYNRYIEEIFEGKAKDNSYSDIEDKRKFFLVRSGKGHGLREFEDQQGFKRLNAGSVGALFERVYYEEFFYKFYLYNENMTFDYITKEDEDEAIRPSDSMEWSDFKTMLIKPYDMYDCFSMGYKILPLTKEIFFF